MSKKELGVIGGIATIVVAATAASQKKRWEQIHQVAAIVGGVITVVSLLS